MNYFFFSLGNTGFSPSFRSEIEESICSASGIRPSCYDPAIGLVIRVLQQKYLQKFLNSKLYQKFLTELFSQIQTSPFGSCANPKASSSRKTSSSNKLKRSSSNTSLSTTCSSNELGPPTPVSSISAQNTLLASMSKSKSDITGRMMMMAQVKKLN